MQAGEMSKSESVTRIFKADLALHVCVLFVTPEPFWSNTPVFETIYGCFFIIYEFLFSP